VEQEAASEVELITNFQVWFHWIGMSITTCKVKDYTPSPLRNRENDEIPYAHSYGSNPLINYSYTCDAMV
jgi:hypothetical protein